MYRIARVSNFNLDFYDEEFVENIPPLTQEEARSIARILNDSPPAEHEHYWRVVEWEYKLRKGKIA